MKNGILPNLFISKETRETAWPAMSYGLFGAERANMECPLQILVT